MLSLDKYAHGRKSCLSGENFGIARPIRVEYTEENRNKGEHAMKQWMKRLLTAVLV